MSKYKKFFCMFLIVLLAVCLLSTTALAAGTGDVAGAIEGTWNDASDQIKTVVIKEMKVLICTEFPAHSWRPQIYKCKLLSQADLWSPLPQIKEMRCVISTMWPLHSERSLE